MTLGRAGGAATIRLVPRALGFKGFGALRLYGFRRFMVKSFGWFRFRSLRVGLRVQPGPKALDVGSQGSDCYRNPFSGSSQKRGRKP